MTHPDTQRIFARVEDLTGYPVAVEPGSGFYEQAQMMSAPAGGAGAPDPVRGGQGILRLQPPPLKMDSLAETTDKIRRFRDARDWMQFHSPKNLACSISIEAGELLELFQWVGADQNLDAAQGKKTEIAHELADVAIYLVELADILGIDLIEAISEKLAINEAKYPAEQVRGSSKKYTEYPSHEP